MTDPITAGMDLAAEALDAVGAIARAADRPDDVDRAAYVGRASGRLRWAIDVYRAAKHPGRRARAARIGARWAEALRQLARPVPVLPWE